MSPEPQEVRARAADGCPLAGLRYPADPDTGRPPGRCLLLHGLGVDANVWALLAPALRDLGFDVLCPDLRGHGRSASGSAWRFGPRRMADDLVVFCRTLGFQPTLVVGQSFGSWIALDLLRRHGGALGIESCVALTPVWFGRHQALAEWLRQIRATLRLLALMKSHGAGPRRTPARRDHQRWAGRPDWHLPRMIDEAGSIGWGRYARLMLWLRLQARRVPPWPDLNELPIDLFVASADGLWHNGEIETIHQLTGWPLERVAMLHVSPAVDPDCASRLARMIASRYPA